MDTERKRQDGTFAEVCVGKRFMCVSCFPFPPSPPSVSTFAFLRQWTSTLLGRKWKAFLSLLLWIVIRVMSPGRSPYIAFFDDGACRFVAAKSKRRLRESHCRKKKLLETYQKWNCTVRGQPSPKEAHLAETPFFSPSSIRAAQFPPFPPAALQRDEQSMSLACAVQGQESDKCTGPK